MKYELIVFDWDGTLLDSAGAIVNAIQAACRDLELPEPSDAQARHVIGLGLVDAMRQAVAAIEVRTLLSGEYDQRELAEAVDRPALVGDGRVGGAGVARHRVGVAATAERGAQRGGGKQDAGGDHESRMQAGHEGGGPADHRAEQRDTEHETSDVLHGMALPTNSLGVGLTSRLGRG